MWHHSLTGGNIRLALDLWIGIQRTKWSSPSNWWFFLPCLLDQALKPYRLRCWENSWVHFLIRVSFHISFYALSTSHADILHCSMTHSDMHCNFLFPSLCISVGCINSTSQSLIHVVWQKDSSESLLIWALQSRLYHAIDERSADAVLSFIDITTAE